MWVLTTALYGSRLQGQECKRKTAVLAPPGVILHTFVELVHFTMGFTPEGLLPLFFFKKGLVEVDFDA